AASVLQGGRPIIVPSAEGASLYGKAFPSVVSFTRDGQVLVGEPAKRQIVSNPEGTITAAKRKMGSKFKYNVFGKEYTPQQISAFILQKIKKDAEEFLGEKISKAVITVPAYFDDDQRQATKDAGKIAGLDVIRIVNEPTAAALAYGLDKKEGEHKILVFDLGGGTLDVTIMEFGDGVFEVKSTSGDTQLGGTDMDVILMNYILKEFEKKEGIDLNNDAMAVQRVKEAAEKAKIELSTTIETDINLPFIATSRGSPKHLTMKITRAQLEMLVEPIIQRCKKPVEQALKDSGLGRNDIDKIILVGGPTRMPVVQKFVENIAGKKFERGLDPMECVAAGAAVQAGVLSGEVKDVLLLDVTPLTLGIETLGGIRTALIERNTTIPTKKSQIFSTAADSQPSVEINVLQGEREMANDNKSLGRFILSGIPPAPRGIPQIEVVFDIDANGIIHVAARDLGTGKSQSIKIAGSQKLDDKEVERMRKEAENFAEEDKKRKAGIEVRNTADSLVYTADKMVNEYGDKVDKETKDKILKEIDELRELLKQDDNEKIKKGIENVNKVLQEIGTKMYAEAAKQQGGNAGGESQNKEEEIKGDNVYDAEVIDEEDDKGKKKK
ncbi:MAG TPA: molecular chaperone DnaK, partial [Candidatus Nanoarchaeia archaeon]|nr:molecular chaperone DnaK [Candidatus Nanoarchaeia archaeon]